MNMQCDVYYKSGNLEYKFLQGLFEWPDSIENRAVSGIACFENEVIVSTRDSKHPILFFDSTGKYSRTIGRDLAFKRTHGLTVESDGTIWICDDQNSVIYHLQQDGRVIHQLGTKGFFSNSGYDPKVRWPHDLYTMTKAAEPFNRPTRIKRSPWGDYYCTDGYGNVAVHWFDSQLRLVKTWGGPGRDAGQFRLPHSLEFDDQHRIWVCDRENFRVQIFDSTGKYIDEIDDLLYPSELWNHNGLMYLCEGDGQVSIFSTDMSKVAVIGYPGCFTGIHSIAVDACGSIYLGRIHGADSLIKLTSCK